MQWIFIYIRTIKWQIFCMRTTNAPILIMSVALRRMILDAASVSVQLINSWMATISKRKSAGKLIFVSFANEGDQCWTTLIIKGMRLHHTHRKEFPITYISSVLKHKKLSTLKTITTPYFGWCSHFKNLLVTHRIVQFSS